MKKMISTAILGGSLALGGCATSGKVQPSVTPAQVNDVIQTVQTDAQKVCGYLPLAETVAKILVTFVSSAAPTIQIASTIVNGICSQVKPAAAAKARARGALPTYRGVPIQGQFVR